MKIIILITRFFALKLKTESKKQSDVGCTQMREDKIFLRLGNQENFPIINNFFIVKKNKVHKNV